jgi:type IV pilus assembly protein PilP
MRVSLVVVLACGLASAACGGDTVSSGPAPLPPAQRVAPASPLGAAALESRTVFLENDFAETDHNRDPFRSFASVAAPVDPPIPNQLKPLLPQYAVDELKLVAIVLGGDDPRAMITDPNGKGWVVKKGDRIGRADKVHTGGVNGDDFELSWRVDRVRDGELVLAREDPTLRSRTATKILALHGAGEGEREQRL